MCLDVLRVFILFYNFDNMVYYFYEICQNILYLYFIIIIYLFFWSKFVVLFKMNYACQNILNLVLFYFCKNVVHYFNGLCQIL